MESGLKELSKYRFERALEELETAHIMLDMKHYKLALNRSYYAIFHSMRAVNILDAFDSSKHSGVIAHFNQHHVKTGDFAKELSKIIRNAAEMREQADYDDFFISSAHDAEVQVSQADTFLNAVSIYLKTLQII